MYQMKDKLIKNHYKGIDKKLKITGIVSSALLFVAICTFVPLTAVLQYQNVEATEIINTQEPATENYYESSAVQYTEQS